MAVGAGRVAGPGLVQVEGARLARAGGGDGRGDGRGVLDGRSRRVEVLGAVRVLRPLLLEEAQGRHWRGGMGGGSSGPALRVPGRSSGDGRSAAAGVGVWAWVWAWALALGVRVRVRVGVVGVVVVAGDGAAVVGKQQSNKDVVGQARGAGAAVQMQTAQAGSRQLMRLALVLVLV